MTLGERIALARKQSELSQARLASLIGVSRGACGQWESGRTSPSVANLAELARSLDVRFEWLATGRGEMQYRHQVSETLPAYESEELPEARDRREMYAIFRRLSPRKRAVLRELLQVL